jgi:hypothetical protein
VNVLGEVEEKISFTNHFNKRWRQRINPNMNNMTIREKVNEIIEKGIKYNIDNLHYRICYDGICIVLMQLSPLHSLAKTVYERDNSTLTTLSAI